MSVIFFAVIAIKKPLGRKFCVKFNGQKFVNQC